MHATLPTYLYIRRHAPSELTRARSDPAARSWLLALPSSPPSTTFEHPCSRLYTARESSKSFSSPVKRQPLARATCVAQRRHSCTWPSATGAQSDLALIRLSHVGLQPRHATLTSNVTASRAPRSLWATRAGHVICGSDTSRTILPPCATPKSFVLGPLRVVLSHRCCCSPGPPCARAR